MVETWKKLAFEDDVLLKSVFNAHSLVYSISDDTPVVLEVAEQQIVGRRTGENITGIAIGIADNDMVQIDGTANDTEWAIFNAAGLEGLTDAEAMAALSGDAGAAFSFNAQQITEFIIQIVADDAAKTALTAVIGNMVWQSDDAALYFCTTGE